MTPGAARYSSRLRTAPSTTDTRSSTPALSRARSRSPAPKSWLTTATPATPKPAWKEAKIFSRGQDSETPAWAATELAIWPMK